MAVFSSIALGIAAVASIASAGIGAVQASKQARLQKKAASAQRKQQELAVRRERRGAIRQAQIARAQTTSAAGAFNALGDSAVAGGQRAAQSATYEPIGYSFQQSNISSDIAGYQSKSNAVGVQFGNIQAALGAVNTAAQFGYNYFKPKEVAAAAAKAAESRIQTAKNRRNYGPSGFFT